MRIWIYGAPFNGKTTFASNFKGAKILSTDGNAEYLFPKEDIIPVKSATDLNNALQKLRANKPETLIIDTTEYLLDFLRFYWLERNKVEHESEIAYKGYGMLREFIWREVVNLANMCNNTIFISHEEVYVEKNKFGREVTYYTPQFDKNLKDKMMGLMSVVMRAVKISNEKNNSSYVLHIGHFDEEFGGTRLDIKETEIPNDLKAFADNFKKQDNPYVQDILKILNNDKENK